ncbi:hypothetical protein IMZ48_38085 [Candidatus Bathyarchaeota archaeon]|nr:hypothetical protein [Candidatus Bathyarchaeota archaeon]
MARQTGRGFGAGGTWRGSTLQRRSINKVRQSGTQGMAVGSPSIRHCTLSQPDTTTPSAAKSTSRPAVPS